MVDSLRGASDAFLVLTLGVQTWGTDVAAGWLIGAAWVAVVVWLARATEARRSGARER